jgi:hypothetical protein
MEKKTTATGKLTFHSKGTKFIWVTTKTLRLQRKQESLLRNPTTGSSDRETQPVAFRQLLDGKRLHRLNERKIHLSLRTTFNDCPGRDRYPAEMAGRIGDAFFDVTADKTPELGIEYFAGAWI